MLLFEKRHSGRRKPKAKAGSSKDGMRHEA